MSDMYAFSISSVEEQVIEIDVYQVHPDAGGFAPTKNFALQMLYGPIHNWTGVGEEGVGSPLDQEFSQEDFYNCDYLRSVCHDYVEKVEITDRDGDSAHYVITLTEAKWGEHLKSGMSWENADFNRGADLPKPQKKKAEVFGPRKRIVRWPDKGLRKLDAETFAQARGLQTLDLSGNYLQELPESFGNMHKLEVLDLRNNVLRSLPESFGELASLQELDLRENQLETLPESFGDLKKLEVLYLSVTNDSMPDTLPESFAELESLRVLVAKGSGMRRLPKAFRKLKLEELRLCNWYSDHVIANLYQICHIASLRVLEISSVGTLPREIGNLVALEELDISSCSLKKLPPSMGKLSRLKQLDASYNELRVLPDDLRALTGLQKLALHDNPLLEMPGWIGELRELQELSFDSYSCRGLPESLGRLEGLENLRLSCRSLVELPESMGALKQLKRLHLDQSQLRRLPRSLAQLQQLEFVSLFDCPLPDAELAWLKQALPDTYVQH